MATLYDGLGGEELAPSGLQAGAVNISPYFTGSLTTASNANIGGNGSVVGSVFGGVVLDSGLYRPNRTSPGNGSPSTFSQGLVLTSSGATGAGSTANVVFSTAFSAVPNVVVSPGSGSLGTSFGLIYIAVGSFGVESSAASKNFQWKAVGAP